MLLGKRLPPYGQNAERAKAWDMACMRHSERSLSHDIAQERAVKMAEELAAAAAQEDFPWARECRCSMRWPLGTRLVIKRVEKALGQNRHGVLSWSVRLNPCAKGKRRVPSGRPSGSATCVARVLRPVVRDTKFIAIRPARA